MMKQRLAFGFLVAVLLAGHAVFHFWWMKRDTRPPGWDESHHLLIAGDYQNSLDAGDWARVLRPARFNYPPLYHLSLTPFLQESGPLQERVDRAVTVNLIYLALLVLAVFFLGCELLSPAAGFMAALLASLSPSVLWLMRRPMIDLPLAAWVALAYLCLVKTDGFRRLFWCAALGAAVGLGLLTKWTFIVYAGVPLAWAFMAGLRDRQTPGALVFLAAAGLVAGPWYVLNTVPSFLRVQKLAGLKEARDPAVWTWEGWTWYVRGLVNYQVLWPLSIPLVLGALAAAWRRHGVLLAWLIVPLIFFTALQNKDLRYAVPWLPAAALLIAGVPAFWRWSLGRRIWNVFWGGLALALGLGYQTAGFWPPGLRSAASAAGLTPPAQWQKARSSLSSLHQDMPFAGDWKTEEILRTLQQEAGPSQQKGRLVRVSLVSNHESFHAWVFRFAAQGLPFPNLHIASPKRRLSEFTDFILWKRGNMGPEFTLGYLAAASDLLQNPPAWFQKSFQKISEWPLPDGSTAVLYKKSVSDMPWPQALGSVEMTLDSFPLAGFEAEGLRVRFEPASATGARQGRFARVLIESQKLDYRGLTLDQVVLDGREVQVNLPLFLETREIRFLEVGEIRPSVRLRAETVEAWLGRKAPWLISPRVRLENGSFRVEGQAKGLSLEIEGSARLSPGKDQITLQADRAAVAGIPLPLALARPLARKTFSLEPGPNLPFHVRVEQVMVQDGAVKVQGPVK
jgi:hypothetical protein